VGEVADMTEGGVAVEGKEKLEASSEQLKALLERLAAEGCSVDLVLGGAYSIKRYYMESSNPRQMRGASESLLRVFAERIPGYLKSEGLWKEYACAYCQGGSQMLAVVPEGKGAELAKQMEMYIESDCVTAFGAAVWEKVSAGELWPSSDKFQEQLCGLFDKFYLRRMGKIDWSDRPDQDLWEKFQKDQKEKIQVPEYISRYQGNELRCDRCRLRQPKYLAQPSGERFLLCTSCAYKEVRGSYRQRKEFREQAAQAPDGAETETFFAQFLEWGLENTSQEYPKMEVDDDIRTTTHLADKNGDFALLYADINNLGGVGVKFENFPAYREFRIAVDETVRQALYSMLWCAMELCVSVNEEKTLTARFEIIAAGGDDICVLLPGNVALFAGTKLVENFEELWKRNYAGTFEKTLGDNANLSLSAGIAVAPATAPLAYMQMAVEMLLKSAKKRAHELKSKEDVDHRGALDILLLQGDGQWGVGLDVLREVKRERDENMKLVRTAERTMRPFSVEEAKAFLEILRCAEREPNHMLYTVAEAGDACTIDEGLLYFDYLKSKMRPEVQTDADRGAAGNGRTGLEKLQQRLRKMLESKIVKDLHEGLYFRLPDKDKKDATAPEKWIFPWRDVVSLQTQKSPKPKEEACV
jgi:hypothetical protein